MTQQTTEKTLGRLLILAEHRWELKNPIVCLTPETMPIREQAKYEHMAQAIATHLEAKHKERVRGLVEALRQMVEVFDSDTARRLYTANCPEGWTMLEIGACTEARQALSDFESNLDSKEKA